MANGINEEYNDLMENISKFLETHSTYDLLDIVTQCVANKEDRENKAKKEISNFISNMRSLTAEEQKIKNEYINSISKSTGINIFNFEDNKEDNDILYSDCEIAQDNTKMKCYECFCCIGYNNCKADKEKDDDMKNYE